MNKTKLTNNHNFKKAEVEQKVLDLINLYRGTVLDLVEQELCEKSNWKFIRSKLLKAFGDRGLTGGIRNLINQTGDKSDDCI